MRRELTVISKPFASTSLKKGLIDFVEIAQAPLEREGLAWALRCPRQLSRKGTCSVVGPREVPSACDRVLLIGRFLAYAKFSWTLPLRIS